MYRIDLIISIIEALGQEALDEELEELLQAGTGEETVVPLDNIFEAIVLGSVNDVDRLLAKSGVNVYVIKSGTRPLKIAGSSEYESLARRLFASGANMEAQDNYVCTALHLASQHDQVEIVQFLLNGGADVNAVDSHGLTSLHYASYFGHENLVHLQIQNADINMKTRDIHGETALHLASRHNRVTIARLLLDRGADVNAVDSHGWAAIHCASYHGHKNMVRVLLQNESSNIDMETRDNHGEKALHVACRKNHVEVAQLLLEGGADVNAVDSHEWTSLHLALSNGDETMVNLLLQHKDIDVNVATDNGMTPLHCLPTGNLGDYSARICLEKGADVNAADADGMTPLHAASGRGQEKVVHMLLEAGANWDVRDHDGLTPVGHATRGVTCSDSMVFLLYAAQGQRLATTDNVHDCLWAHLLAKVGHRNRAGNISAVYSLLRGKPDLVKDCGSCS